MGGRLDHELNGIGHILRCQGRSHRCVIRLSMGACLDVTNTGRQIRGDRARCDGRHAYRWAAVLHRSGAFRAQSLAEGVHGSLCC